MGQSKCSCRKLLKIYFRVMPFVQLLDGLFYFVMGTIYSILSASNFTFTMTAIGIVYFGISILGMCSRRRISLFFPWAFLVLGIIAFQLVVGYAVFFERDYVNSLMYDFDQGYDDPSKHMAYDIMSHTINYSKYTLISTTASYIIAALTGSIFYSIKRSEQVKREKKASMTQEEKVRMHRDAAAIV